MFKNFEQKGLVFTESVYNTKYLEHYCDDSFSIYQYKKDRTFNEMRRDVYFESQANSLSDITDLTFCYGQQKNELKQKNKLLHDLFFNNKKIKIGKIIKDFDIVEVNQTPNAFKKEISNGRFIFYDGNSICFLGEDDTHFYIVHWSGS